MKLKRRRIRPAVIKMVICNEVLTINETTSINHINFMSTNNITNMTFQIMMEKKTLHTQLALTSHTLVAVLLVESE